MFLDIGNRQRIDEPTAEQVEHCLRNLPAEGPFLILNADEEHFVQAMPVGERFRVEWRQEAEQRVAFVPIDRAVEALLAFHRWDEPALMALPWRRLRWWHDSYRVLGIMGAGLVVISLIKLWWWLR